RRTSNQKAATLARLRPRGMPQSPPFADENLREGNGVAGVAAGQTPWLAGHAIEPLEADLAHPHRRSRSFACHEIDRRCAAQRSLGLPPIAMRVHPQLLLWRSKADDQYLRPRDGDSAENRLIFCFIAFEAEWRAVRADDCNCRPAAANVGRGPLGN